MNSFIKVFGLAPIYIAVSTLPSVAEASHNLQNGDQIRIYSWAQGEKCGLQWDEDAGTPSTLGPNERVAKWDCHGDADPMLVANDRLWAWRGSEWCPLEWHGTSGEPSSTIRCSTRR